MITQKDYLDAITVVKELEDALKDLCARVLSPTYPVEVQRVVSVDLSRPKTVKCVIEVSDQSGCETRSFAFPWFVVKSVLEERAGK